MISREGSTENLGWGSTEYLGWGAATKKKNSKEHQG